MNKHAVAENAAWMIGCRLAHGLLQLLIGTLTARYLGPSDYGLIHFAASVTAFALPMMQLGLSSTLVQEYVENRDREGEILGTSLGLNLLSGLFCAAGVTLLCAAAGDRDRTVVCALYSISLIFQAPELVRCRFQARLQSKYSAPAGVLGYLAVSAYRVFLLATGKSAAWFALSHSLEFAVAGGVLLHQCRRTGVKALSFSRKRAKALLTRSRHYIPAALLVTCFQNIDHVLLTLLSGEGANGLYTCAVTCANLTGFVFYALVDSFQPVILSCREDSRRFENTMAGLYGLMIWLGLGQSLAFTLLARPLIGLLYGSAYAGAVKVLQILVWNTAFSMMGAVRNIWLLAEEKHHLLWRINLAGAVGNVILNSILIPRWGAVGAALASVLTQMLANFWGGWLIGGMEENQILLLKGLNVGRIRAFLRQM